MSQRGVLLVNTGSPDSPEVADVRRYLGQFLMDGRVLDQPWLLRKLLVSGFILPRRPQRSAEAYRAIWWPEGSPQVVSAGGWPRACRPASIWRRRSCHRHC